MALSLSSPCGYALDEDEEMAVFESTAAEHGGPSRPRLPEISVISPGLSSQPELVRKEGFWSFCHAPFTVFTANCSDFYVPEQHSVNVNSVNIF